MYFRQKHKSPKPIAFIQPLSIAYLAIGIFYITRVLGITTFVYEPMREPLTRRPFKPAVLQVHGRRQQFGYRLRLSYFLRCYSIALLISITASIPFALYAFHKEIKFFSLSKLRGLVRNMRYVLIQGFTAISLLSICCMQHRLLQFLNRWLRMHYSLRSLALQLNIGSAEVIRLQRLDLHSCLLLCIKILLLMLVPVPVVYSILRIERPQLFAGLLFNCCCSILQQTIIVFYDVCALRVGHYGKQINVLLQYALAEARQHLTAVQPLNEHRRNRMFRLCKLIKRLHGLYQRNLQLSRELERIFNTSLLVYLFYFLALSSAQLFVFYFVSCSHSAADLRIARNMDADSCSLPRLAGLHSVLTMLANFCLLVWGTHFMQAQLCSTRYILTEGSFELPPARDNCNSRDYELQLEAVLAEFALYLRMEHQQQHRHGKRYVYFMVCGLFALERRLIFVLFETILNYLIILIQYDKVA